MTLTLSPSGLYRGTEREKHTEDTEDTRMDYKKLIKCTHTHAHTNIYIYIYDTMKEIGENILILSLNIRHCI